MAEFVAPSLLRARGKSAQKGHVSDAGADDLRYCGLSSGTVIVGR
jgi:hypothetical protein